MYTKPTAATFPTGNFEIAVYKHLMAPPADVCGVAKYPNTTAVKSMYLLTSAYRRDISWAFHRKRTKPSSGKFSITVAGPFQFESSALPPGVWNSMSSSG